jgi:hypothetical protein
MVTKRRLGENSVFFCDERCSMQSWYLGKGVVLSTVRGLQSDELAPLILEEAEAQLRRFNRVVFFVDARESRQMTTAFREQMTAWFAAHKEVATVHMLLHSKLLEMALNLANLATGTATARAYANLASWEAAGQKEILGFKARELTIPDDLREAQSG